MSYAEQAEQAARLAERLTLAVLLGTVQLDAVRDALTLAGHQRDVYRQADAVARFRAGEPLVCVPSSAPWSGF